MIILVTGGTGFIGRRLIKELIREGHSVVALARNPVALPNGIEDVLKGDIESITAKEMSSFMVEKGVEVLIHLAAMMSFYPSDETRLWNINVEGTKRLGEACVEAGVEKMVYISSTEAMGARRSPHGRALTEEDECRPHFKYGHSKLAAELALKSMAPNLKFVILRLTGVLGPGDDFSMYELLRSISLGLFFFQPSHSGKLMFTHIDDVIQGIMCAIPDRAGTVGNTYIICPDNCLSYSSIILLGCKLLHRIPPIISLPLPVIRVITMFLAPVLNLGKQKIFLFKPETIDRLGEDRWYSNEKAKRELHYRPRFKLEEAIYDTTAHMLKNGEVNTWFISPVMLIFAFIFVYIILRYFL